jgi:ankyrin repeat protein
LEELPETLNGTYERILREIKGVHQKSAHRLFQCITVASRPLRVKELAEIFAFDFNTGSIPKFREDWRRADPVRAVLSTCSSLLAVVNIEDTQVIQFSHLSVKEFLTSEHLSKANDAISHYHISMTPAHTLVTRACLCILLHLPKDVTRDSLQKYHLAEYAAEHWADHARFKDVLQHVEDEMKCLFDPSESHLAVWVWIHNPEPSFGRQERAEIPFPPTGTPLHYAALYGLHSIVESLITEHSQGVDSQGFGDRRTPLHEASSRGHIEVAQVLLKHGAIAKAQDGGGWTPLHSASDGGHIEIARLLIEHGAVVTAQDKGGWTPLHQASYRRHFEVSRLLIEHGAVVTTQDDDGWTPLHWASCSGHVELARLFIEHGAVVTPQNGTERTPLHSVSSGGHTELAQLLFDCAVATAEYEGWPTPLHQASYEGHVKLARLFIERGASGSTPLHQASHGGHVELARLLIVHGAVATAQDETGSTPLHRASSGGHVELARLLIEHGAVATARDESGSTPLHRASDGGHVELARMLIEHGAVATARDETGSTPLHRASDGGHVELVRLLEHSVAATSQDGDRQTPPH